MSDAQFYLLASLILISFAVSHSVLASPWVKGIFQRGETRTSSWYRLLYNLKSIAFLALYAALSLPVDQIMYRITGIWFWFFIAIQILGASIVFRVLFIEFDPVTFAGFRDEPNRPPTELKKTGVYSLCRHPIYFGTMLLLGFSPIMTRALAVLAVFTFFYGLIGGMLEERRLVAEFGDAYRAYRRSTKRIIPFLL